MKTRLSLSLVLLLSLLTLWSCTGSDRKEEIRVDIIHTTDLHGNVFPYDFINGTDGKGSYARIATYVNAYRQNSRDLLLLDAGDILQGQPTAYYYNFIDTLSHHLMADLFNHLEYDAITIGNHDIETGHAVYDRWVRSLNAPVLGANVTDIERSVGSNSTKPYFTPYTIINKAGKRFAILGLTTPAVPNFLPEVLWSGMRFEDMVETARRYMPEIEAASPDYVIALVHSGIGEKSDSVPYLAEDAGYAIAKNVPGIDLVLLGHDHRNYIDSVIHDDGSKTYLLNPGNNGHRLSRTTVTFSIDSDGNPVVTSSPSLIDLDQLVPDGKFVQGFSPQYNTVKEFVSRPIGKATAAFDSRRAFFGPSAFIDLIHQVQFSLFKDVDVSLSAPLVFDTRIEAGEIYMSDLFKLYKYENMVYLMRLSGEELKKTLEESYDRWIVTMQSPEGRVLRIEKSKQRGSFAFEEPFFNFDSAAGIRYTVDVTKPKGERVIISEMRDGTAFDPKKEYLVAINSYRGNGGGGLLTEGAGIPHSELSGRIVEATTRDLRYYLMKYIEEHSPLVPRSTSTWSFEPAEWTHPALKRDSIAIFTSKSGR